MVINKMENINYEREVVDDLMGEKYLCLPKIFIQKFGPSTAIYLCCLIEWRGFMKEKYILDPKSPFFMTQEKIRERVFLSDERQKLSLKKLEELNILTIERGGVRNRNNYKINFESLYFLLKKPLESPSSIKSSDRETPPLKNDPVTEKPPHYISKPLLTTFSKPLEVFSYEKTVGSCDPSNSIKPKLLSRENKSPITFFSTQSHRKDVSKVINYWNASPGLSHHRAGTKTFEQIIKTIGEVIDGKFLQDWPPYVPEDIIKSIDGYKTRLSNLDYSPANKDSIKGLNLSNFFWNPYTSYIQSMFLECLNVLPKLLKNAVPKEEEVNPQLTKWLQKFYIDKILLGQPKVFNQQEVNKFIKGANLLSFSIPNLRERANLTTGPMEFCEYTILALLDQFPLEEIKPGNIGSEWTFNECLPRYLSKIGRID